MAQNADYQKLNWQDLPSEVTPLSAANLNRMEDGIEAGANFRLPGKLFDSSEDLDEYLEISSDGSAAGQTVTVKEGNKYKQYILNYDSATGTYQKKSSGAGVYVGETLPDIATADPDLDYYIGTDATSYVHWRVIGTAFQTVGGDSYSKDDMDDMLGLIRSSIGASNEEIQSIKNRLTAVEARKGFFYTFTYGTEEIGGEEKKNVFSFWRFNNEADMDDPSKGTLVKRAIIEGGGGSGSSSNLKLTKVTPSPLIITPTDKTEITVNYQSEDSSGSPVDGKYTIKQVEPYSRTVMTGDLVQGDNTFDLTEFSSVGTNRFSIQVEDDNGATGSVSYNVRIVDVRIESDYDDSGYTAIGRRVDFGYTPYGLISKTVHFSLDGVEDTIQLESAGTPQIYQIDPQPYGHHMLEVWITAEVSGKHIETAHIYKDLVWYEDDPEQPPIVKTSYRYDYRGTVDVNQYDVVPIDLSVFDPLTKTPEVVFSVDGVEVDRKTLSTSSSIWRYKASTTGLHELSISCRGVTVPIKINTNALTIDVSPITTGLEVDFNPEGLTNDSDNRLWTNGNYSMSVSENFDWANGGYKTDEEGNAYFCIKAGTRASFNYYMFPSSADASPSAVGAEMKLIFRTENVQNAEATWFTNVETSQVGQRTIQKGIQLNVHNGWLKTNTASDEDVIEGDESIAATNTYLYLPYSEEDRIELDINVDVIGNREKAFVLSYEDGVPLKSFVFGQSDQFYQGTPKPIVIGSDDCDVRIYRMKLYSTALSSESVMRNFIADAPDSSEMVNRYNRNSIYYNSETGKYTPYQVAGGGKLDPIKLAEKCKDLRVLMLECPTFTTSKKDFIKNSNLRCIYKNGDPYWDNWYFENGYHAGQGTTSDKYGVAGRNVDFLFNVDGVHHPSDKITTVDPNYISAVTFGYGTDAAHKYTTVDANDINDPARVTLTRTSIPNNFFNFKVNIASSENANNALLQKRYNDFLPYISPAKIRDSRIKNDMEFVPAVLFIREMSTSDAHSEFSDTEWHFYAIGNLGDSKKTDYTRAYDPSDMNEFTIEISDNTMNNSTFQTGVYLDGQGNRVVESISDTAIHEYVYPITANEWNPNNKRYYTLYNEKFDGDHSFEPRYACCGDYRDGKIVNDTHGPGEDAAQLLKNEGVWRAFYRWVITSTDEEFINQYEEWCVKSAMTFFYAYTHHHTLMDNRAKNTFWHFAKTGVFRAMSKPVAELLHVYCELVNGEYVPTTDTTINPSKTYYSQYAIDIWVYDTDTGLGINNNGELVFPFGKEDTDYVVDGMPNSGYVFNGALSTFWCRTRDNLYGDIDATYQNVDKRCWQDDSLINEFDLWQATYPEELWRLDIVRKYIRSFNGTSVDNSIPKKDELFLRDMMQGRKKYQRREWIRNQHIYFGTKHISTEIKDADNMIYFRVVTPVGTLAVEPNYDIAVVPYSDMYISVQYGTSDPSPEERLRAKANTYHVVESPEQKWLSLYYELVGGEYVKTTDVAVDPSKTYYSMAYVVKSRVSFATETQISIYGATKIRELSDLSACYIRSNSFEAAVKLKKLVLGDTTPGYANPQLTGLSIGSNKMLEELDIRNCTALQGVLNLSSYVGLKKLYAEGTKISGVIFAENGKVDLAHLPDNYLMSLVMKNLNSLDSEGFDCSLDTLTDLTLQGGLLDAKSIVSDTKDTLTTLKLYHINWTLANQDLLDDIYALASSEVTGYVYLPEIRRRDLAKFNRKWPSLTIDATSIYEEYPVYFLNYDGTPVRDTTGDPYVEWVEIGQYAHDPIVGGQVLTPTKPQTAKHTYTYDHWSVYAGGVVSSEVYQFNEVILGPVTLMAVYTEALRTFKVRCWTSDVNIATMQQGIWNSSLNPVRTQLGQDIDVEYGSYVDLTALMSTFQTRKCVPHLTGNTPYYEAYNFIDWDKSAGYVTEDMDIFAIWRYAKVFQNVDGTLRIRTEDNLRAKYLHELTSAELQVVAAIRDNNGSCKFAEMFDNRDYVAWTMGYDPNFSNVESDTIVSLEDGPVFFEGLSAFMPTDENDDPYVLFAADSPSFTMAIDYRYTANANGSLPAGSDTQRTLFSCFERPDDGNYGFRVRYLNSKMSLMWGDKNQNIANQTNRDMLVIRHQQGSNKLYIYTFIGDTSQANGYTDAGQVIELTRNNDQYPATNAPLVFGGIAEYDSSTGKYKATTDSTYFGSGAIHWCKVWYDDLGESVAKKIASWTRDEMRMENYELQLDTANTLIGAPYKLDRTVHTSAPANSFASASFVSNAQLRYTHRMNSDNVNTGGWGGNPATGEYEFSMHYFMNHRWVPGVPNEYACLFATVLVKSTSGGGGSTIAAYSSIGYIPCRKEEDGTNDSGYTSEMDSYVGKIPWNNSNNATRLKFRDVFLNPPHFEPLPTEPSAWSTNWAKYYVWDEATSSYKTLQNAGYSNAPEFVANTFFEFSGSITLTGVAVHTGASEPIFGQSKGLYDYDTNPTGVREFDIWQNGNNQGFIFVTAETAKERGLTLSTEVSQGTTVIGGWVGAGSCWLRSPGVGYTSYFWNVSYNGGVSNFSYASTWYGVCPCVSLYAELQDES